MELFEVDTRYAYEQLREKIVTLELAPGALLNDQALAEEFKTGVSSIREAIKLLIYDELVVSTPRHGFYVADINISDLEQLSEMRLTLEPLCAKLAAQRSDRDDWAVLEALRNEQLSIDPNDTRQLLDIDHKFHQALVRAAKNKYLARSLEYFFGLSQRLWFLVLPKLDFLSSAVAEHLDIVNAIRQKDTVGAEQIMFRHVKSFYDQVRSVLQFKE